MPRVSARRKTLKELRECQKPIWLLTTLSDSDSEDLFLDVAPEFGGDFTMDEDIREQTCVRVGHSMRTRVPDVVSESEEEEQSDDDVVGYEPVGEGTVMDTLQPTVGEQFPQFLNESDSETEAENMYEMFALLQESILDHRYMLDRFNIHRPVEGGYSKLDNMCVNDFRVITRLSRESFRIVLNLIKDNPIFKNDSLLEQAPVHWQLACALDRLGNDGNGASAARSKNFFGTSHGTVFLYYKRVLHALNGIRTEFIQWPQAERRREISVAMEQKGFKGVIGFVDGTTFPLHCKPGFRGHKYMDRKKQYSIGAQVVCDHQNCIIHFMTGMPGSVHDSRYFSQSPVMQDPSDCFSLGEYLLADSAYKSSINVVSAYKENQRDNPADEDEDERIAAFNEHLARARAVNEHTIGILKARWSSLRGLRLNLQTQQDIFKVLEHTVACVVLHNLALEAADPWEEEIDPNDLEPPPPRRGNLVGNMLRTAGQRKRYQVRMAWEEWFQSQEDNIDL